MEKIKAEQFVAPNKRVKFKPITARGASIKAYRAELKRVVAAAAKRIKEDIKPRYTNALSENRTDVAYDWFYGLEQDLENLTAKAIALVTGLIKDESGWHRKTFTREAKSKLGIDLSRVILENDLDDLMLAASQRNAAFIKGMSDDLLKVVKAEVTSSYIAGDSYSKLAKKLEKKLRISRNRAELIAQDQMSKLSTDLNRARQTQIGIEKYEWYTSLDERVRARHRRLHGRVYRWDEPTDAEDGLHAGQPIRCRCIPIAVIET